MKTVRLKMSTIRASFQNTSFDPLIIDDYCILFDELGTLLNATVEGIKVYGLSERLVKDIATNANELKASVLISGPSLKISGFYSMQHPYDRTIPNDVGEFFISLKPFHTTLSFKILTFNRDNLIVSELDLKSFYDNIKDSFKSFNHGSNLVNGFNETNKILKEIIVENILKEVDDKLYEVYNKVLAEKILNKRYILARELKALGHSRHKRQVPCEIGEDLDEYVDSLFRFGARLIKAMEPFDFWNFTLAYDTFNVKAFLHSGEIYKAYTIRRFRPSWVLCANDSISLGLSITFKELRIKFQFRTIFEWSRIFDGELEVQLKRPLIQVSFLKGHEKLI